MGGTIEARHATREIERIVTFKLVSPNEFLCSEIVLSFCWKLFHSARIVEAFVRPNYCVCNQKSGDSGDWPVLPHIVLNDTEPCGRAFSDALLRINRF